jgi:hypothetical protein
LGLLLGRNPARFSDFRRGRQASRQGLHSGGTCLVGGKGASLRHLFCGRMVDSVALHSGGLGGAELALTLGFEQRHCAGERTLCFLQQTLAFADIVGFGSLTLKVGYAPASVVKVDVLLRHCYFDGIV